MSTLEDKPQPQREQWMSSPPLEPVGERRAKANPSRPVTTAITFILLILLVPLALFSAAESLKSAVHFAAIAVGFLLGHLGGFTLLGRALLGFVLFAVAAVIYPVPSTTEQPEAAQERPATVATVATSDVAEDGPYRNGVDAMLWKADATSICTKRNQPRRNGIAICGEYPNKNNIY